MKRKAMARTAFECGVFPLGLFAAVVGGRFIYARTEDSSLTVLAVSLVAAVVILLLEWFVPERSQWRPGRRELMVDLVHNAVSGGVTNLVHALVVTGLLSVAVHLAALSPVALWPRGLHWTLQLLLALVVGEFLPYWWHRLAHRIGIFWRLHATHHSPDKLHMINAARFHPIDVGLMYVVSVAPLVILGCGAETLAIWSVFTAVHGLFQHCNVRHRPGVLNWLLSSADLHRWHHAVDSSYTNCNFGQNLIVWDVVFGTRHLPAERLEQVGIAKMPDFPTTYVGQLASPFSWTRLHQRPLLNRLGFLPIPDEVDDETVAPTGDGRDTTVG